MKPRPLPYPVRAEPVEALFFPFSLQKDESSPHRLAYVPQPLRTGFDKLRAGGWAAIYTVIDEGKP